MHEKTAAVMAPKKESKCPVDHASMSAMSKPPHPPASAPSTTTTEKKSSWNPLNYMFADISQEKAADQKIALDTEREPSTIPKGTGDGNWEYPSPQQMYNALLRKGYTDTDPEHVTSMVSVHNYLNEGAWNEVRVWEGLYAKGLAEGWKRVRRGEQGIAESSVIDDADPKLMRFQGRPKEMTPKAAFVQFLGRIYPSKFATAPPFDRHDWYVERKLQDGTTKEVRYVIDYYEGDDEPNGEPVFYLDVRPAVDSPILAAERVMRWGGDVWHRASGAEVREEMKRNANK